MLQDAGIDKEDVMKLELIDLNKHYGEKKALDNLNVTFTEGLYRDTWCEWRREKHYDESDYR